MASGDKAQAEMEAKIQVLLETFDVSIYTPYENIIKHTLSPEEKWSLEQYLTIMQVEGLILIQRVSGMVSNQISLTQTGKIALHNGGYKQFLIRKAEKENKETEAHKFAKETNEYSEGIHFWTVRTFWVAFASGIIGLLVLIATIILIVKDSGDTKNKSQTPVSISDTILSRKQLSAKKDSSSPVKQSYRPPSQIPADSSHSNKRDSGHTTKPKLKTK